jgi:hypothetical protein
VAANRFSNAVLSSYLSTFLLLDLFGSAEKVGVTRFELATSWSRKTMRPHRNTQETPHFGQLYRPIRGLQTISFDCKN